MLFYTDSNGAMLIETSNSVKTTNTQKHNFDDVISCVLYTLRLDLVTF